MPGTNSSSGMNAGMSFSSGCPQADSSEALVAPTLLSIMNSRLFIEDPKPQMNTDEHRSNSDRLNQCSLCLSSRGSTPAYLCSSVSICGSISALPMTDVAIDTHASCAMALDAPTHRLIHFAAHSVHLSDLAVTRRAFEPRLDVRLVRVKHICLGLVPIHTSPRRLLFALCVGR